MKGAAVVTEKARQTTPAAITDRPRRERASAAAPRPEASPSAVDVADGALQTFGLDIQPLDHRQNLPAAIRRD